jgi:ATP-dependent protease ClpP protease subunit
MGRKELFDGMHAAPEQYEHHVDYEAGPPFSLFTWRNSDGLAEVQDAYLYGELRTPMEYTPLLAVIEKAPPGSEVNIHINSPGGDYNTLASLMHAMSKSKAKFTGHLDGDASSAAAILICSFKRISVFQWSTIFFHNIQMSFGAQNDSTKIMKEITNMRSVYHKMMLDICSGVLTRDEIDSICLSESDLFMSGPEFIKRAKDAGRTII